METVTQPVTPINPPEKEMPSLSPDTAKSRKLWLVIAGVFIILAIITTIAVLSAIFALRNQNNAVPQTPPPVTETPISVTTPPSKYASDAGVLKLKDDLKNLQQKIDTIDFFEPEITPPNLDLTIKIQPQ